MSKLMSKQVLARPAVSLIAGGFGGFGGRFGGGGFGGRR